MGLILGCVGVTIVVQVIDCTTEAAFDISTATTKQIVITYPSSKTQVKTASFQTDGHDGRLTYTTGDGDLDEPGIYSVHAHLIMPTFSGPTSEQYFELRGIL